MFGHKVAQRGAKLKNFPSGNFRDVEENILVYYHNLQQIEDKVLAQNLERTRVI